VDLYHLTALDRDACGYVASALVLATFSMRSMRALRLMAIASNVAFIGYAAMADLHPILALHATLLPLNLMRLLQEQRSFERRSPACRMDSSFHRLFLLPKATSIHCASGPDGRLGKSYEKPSPPPLRGGALNPLNSR
jgi:hypothetical protein